MIATISTSAMKAVVCERPGLANGLKVKEIPKPAVPDDGVLVRVRASSANPVDLFPTSPAGYMMTRDRPLILGTDFAGTVESVGKDVTAFRTGDEVFGGARGAFAEFVCLAETKAIARKPAGVTFEQAGAVAVAGVTALQALRDRGGIQPGRRVLINGASGGVGTFAVQIAKALGGEVTAVCSSRNVDMVRSLGAEEVIDYTKSDFTQGHRQYDLIIDLAGTHSFTKCKRVLKPAGSFVGTGASGVQHSRMGTLRALGHFLGTRLRSMGSGHRVVSLFIADLNQKDMEFLAGLMEAGKLIPAVERRYELRDVGAALGYLNTGHAKAKIAIQVSDL